jgi:ankyrin repeat protein
MAAEIAMRNGHASTAALLEADPRTVHIHDACFDGRTLVVLALLKQGCPPCYRDNREGMLHQTPLMAAASAGAYEVVKVLLSVPEIRENVDMADDLGHTALMRAAGAGALQVTPLILSAGCDRNRTDRRGRTAREHAANHGVSTMLKYMSQMVIYKEIK